MLEDYSREYTQRRRAAPTGDEDDPTAYTDRYGIRRHRGRVGSGSMGSDIKDAAFDIWGNFVGGRDRAGGRVEGGPPVTGIDRWKLANDPQWAAERGIDTARLDDRFRLTPNIDRMQRTNNPQVTSSGKRWGDAVQAARNQDATRDEYHKERLARYQEFNRALAQRRSREPYGGYGRYGYTAGYQGSGGIRGSSTGSAYSIGGAGIVGGSTGSAYST